MAPLTNAFEDLSHAFRVLLEADFQAHRNGLLLVDRAEAVGNIDLAYTTVLNSFHSLYDAMSKEEGLPQLDWYDAPELATILFFRNARHHNHANKIRTMYDYYVQESPEIGKLQMYILVDFPAQEDGADTFDVYLSWADFKKYLSLPTSISRLKETQKQKVCDYLAVEKFKNYSELFELEERFVFFNVIPLFVNAAIKLIPSIKAFVSPRSTESETFLSLFDEMLPANTQRHEVNCGPISLLK